MRVLQEHDFAAERIPLSGAAGGSDTGDITVPVLGIDRRVEVKCRAAGFAQLYAWLGANDLLIVKRDRDEPLGRGAVRRSPSRSPSRPSGGAHELEPCGTPPQGAARV